MDFVGLFERCASFLQSQQRRPGYRPLCDQSGTEQSWANTLNAIWSTWCRLGFPQNVQVDNELVFYGSRQYPRGMGILIRLCLLHDVQPWFIPMAEPWRNGVIEKFNDHYQNGFLQRVVFAGKKICHNNPWPLSKSTTPVIDTAN